MRGREYAEKRLIACRRAGFKGLRETHFFPIVLHTDAFRHHWHVAWAHPGEGLSSLVLFAAIAQNECPPPCGQCIFACWHHGINECSPSNIQQNSGQFFGPESLATLSSAATLLCSAMALILSSNASILLCKIFTSCPPHVKHMIPPPQSPASPPGTVPGISFAICSPRAARTCEVRAPPDNFVPSPPAVRRVGIESV